MKRAKVSARSRRVDPLPGLSFNLEVLGIGLLCAAIVLALSLALPHGQSGWFGPVVKEALHGWFGVAGAWLFMLAVLALAVIIFMEVRMPRTMAGLAACAAGEFLVIDCLLGSVGNGGIVGDSLAIGLQRFVGLAGANVILFSFAIALAIAPTGISLKRTSAGLADSARSLLAKIRSLTPQRSKTIATSADRPAELARCPSTDGLSPVPTTQTSAGVDAPQAQAQTGAASSAASHVQEIAPNGSTEDAAAPTAGIFAPIISPEVSVLPPPPPDLAKPAARGNARGGYHLPDFAMFNPPEKRIQNENSAAVLLEETLASFGVTAAVTHIERGPSVTRYEMMPGKGVKVSAIKSLSDNIQMALAAHSIRIEAPIPGKAAVGIEVPNSAVSLVAIREILDYLPKGDGKLSIGLGKDISGRPIIADLGRMPHLLVAGATGAGKSVCLNVILASLLSISTPDQVQLLLIDPKRVELTSYTGIPHLIKDTITDPKLAAGALYELTKEMDSRYERFARAGVRKIEEYNQQYPEERLPYIIVVIDELADLMLVAPTRVETSICRIAQLARATGIHLVVATQRPSVDVITGLIKANIPSRIAFAVSSQVDSRTILDMAGAERLLGRGDMLYLPIDAPKPVRVQGALVTGDEIERLCEFWREQDDPDNRIDIALSEVQEEGAGPADDLAYEAARIIIERQMASVALLQAELKVGHPRAVRLIKILEEYRIVGPSEGTKPRKIMVGEGDVEQLAAMLAPRRPEQTLL
ncbi:MAG: hypothetical protein GIW99_08905 [Candidatus Eremiobacteraeota bacterium]|nr:hypothetical protein [Candidatus Eremiobacteraeota bacterium]MBC5827782.1 hypothetical protein [Candidatus Eremiobacteraeota bacterium]